MVPVGSWRPPAVLYWTQISDVVPASPTTPGIWTLVPPGCPGPSVGSTGASGPGLGPWAGPVVQISSGICPGPSPALSDASGFKVDFYLPPVKCRAAVNIQGRAVTTTHTQQLRHTPAHLHTRHIYSLIWPTESLFT